MNNLDLKKVEVQEMDNQQLRASNGGLFKMTFKNWIRIMGGDYYQEQMGNPQFQQYA